uniref:Uncharacterized protein n=1 Tax=Steinernema glaseri TaxID=37863 RepID=A0A1I7YRD4_9BILA
MDNRTTRKGPGMLRGSQQEQLLFWESLCGLCGTPEPAQPTFSRQIEVKQLGSANDQALLANGLVSRSRGVPRTEEAITARQTEAQKCPNWLTKTTERLMPRQEHVCPRKVPVEMAQRGRSHPAKIGDQRTSGCDPNPKALTTGAHLPS